MTHPDGAADIQKEKERRNRREIGETERREKENRSKFFDRNFGDICGRRRESFSKGRMGAEK